MKHFAIITVTEEASVDEHAKLNETFYNNRTLVVRLLGIPLFRLHHSQVNEHVPRIQKHQEPCDHLQD